VDIITFIATVVVVTASGALAPGPLFFANVSHGSRKGAKSGLAFSVAHTIVEFSLVILIALGVLAVTKDTVSGPAVQSLIELVGGVALMVFGVLQIREFVTPKSVASDKESKVSKNPLLVGLAFTGLNPYFLVWWLTNGPYLISISLAFASWAGLIIMYIAHVWMDYAWLTTTAYLAKKGTNLVSSKVYRLIMILFGVIIILFGASLILF
jgi:threonine/homoserine/homoserine lactone efflux protein